MRVWFILLTVALLAGCAQEGGGEVDDAAIDIHTPVQPPPDAVIRKPAVAGAFYPGEKDALKEMVDGYLAAAPKRDYNGIMALVSPHAGYIYSGQVAAHGYRQLEGQHYDTVVIIGPSHHIYFDGISVYEGDYFETPLGNISFDRELSRALIEASPRMTNRTDAHVKEHSVEVQLPFLQEVLGDFKVVMMVMGAQTRENIDELARVLAEELRGRKVLLVASSDLSHYYPYDTAVNLDHLCLYGMQALDDDGLWKDIIDGRTEMCGYGPVLAVMKAAKALGASGAEVVKYANSGDVTGDRNRVVGYASVVIYGPAGSSYHSEEEREELLRIARTSIETYVREGRVPEVEVSSDRLKEPGAAFVTITEDGQLRGCIGTTVAVQPLYLQVQDSAISAATRDRRFMPLTVEELDDIHLEISILTPPKRITSIDEIQVGRHGLIMRQGMYSGLLLPQVATDWGWDKYTFLAQTCRKAGLPEDCWQKGAEIYTFEAEVFHEG
jgi:hypothetical protein